MAAKRTDNCDECAWEIRRCDKLLALFGAGRISLKEYACGFAFPLIACPGRCMEICVDHLPASVAADLFVFLEGFLKPVDFMPGPELFMADTRSADDIEKMKLKLRPGTCSFTS